MHPPRPSPGLQALDREIQALRECREPTEAEKLSADRLLNAMKLDGRLDAQEGARLVQLELNEARSA